jgi:hypothetical protein
MAMGRNSQVLLILSGRALLLCLKATGMSSNCQVLLVLRSSRVLTLALVFGRIGIPILAPELRAVLFEGVQNLEVLFIIIFFMKRHSGELLLKPDAFKVDAPVTFDPPG